jgi:predicted O-methyltransferase YrrM
MWACNGVICFTNFVQIGHLVQMLKDTNTRARNLKRLFFLLRNYNRLKTYIITSQNRTKLLFKTQAF